MFYHVMPKQANVVDSEAAAQFVLESNAIEGILEFDQNEPYFYQHKTALVRALEMALMQEKPDILYWHHLLLNNILPSAGQYRTMQVIVGDYRPPMAMLVLEKMDALIAAIKEAFFVANNHELTEDQCWHFHYWFENIHPFEDGNGRVGRILLAYLYYRSGLGLPIVEHKHKFDYYRAIEVWRRTHLALNW